MNFPGNFGVDKGGQLSILVGQYLYLGISHDQAIAPVDICIYAHVAYTHGCHSKGTTTTRTTGHLLGGKAAPYLLFLPHPKELNFSHASAMRQTRGRTLSKKKA